MWVGSSCPTLLIFLSSNALVAAGPHRPTYSLDRIFLLWNIHLMVWEVEFTDEFEVWWHSLSEGEQAEIDAKVDLLQEHGPLLPRPHADVIASSRHSNMKELRGKVDHTAPASLVRVRPSPDRTAPDRRRQDGR